LHYAARESTVETVALLVNTWGADVLVKNTSKATPYDVAKKLTVRQFLLPLQLSQESERGLAPVVLGATTAQSLGLGGGPTIGPPPPPAFQPPPPPAAPAAPGNHSNSNSQPPSSESPPPPVWKPPRPDGFASSAASSSCGPQDKTPPAQNAAPLYNQFSAFNAGAAISTQRLSSRYVANWDGNETAAPPTAPTPSPLAPVVFTPFSQVPQAYSPTMGGQSQLEEVSLSSSSSSVM